MRIFRHSGAALAVALVMLVVLTLIGVTAMKMSATHFRIAGNLQIANEVEMAARNAIEEFVSSHTVISCGKFPVLQCIDGRQICIAVSAQCMGRAVSDSEGSSISSDKQVYDSYWEFVAEPESEYQGANIRVHWGLMIPFSNFCPKYPSSDCPENVNPVSCEGMTCS